MLFSLSLTPIYGMGATKDICQIIKQHPSWYQDAQKVFKKTQVPVYVQFAIIEKESHFKNNAHNIRSTAFGYAQVVDEIWDKFKTDTHSTKARRDNFDDAVRFIGWYATQMQQQLHISPKNAYALYLAYHDGADGYLKVQHKKSASSKALALNVAKIARSYQNQLKSC